MIDYKPKQRLGTKNSDRASDSDGDRLRRRNAIRSTGAIAFQNIITLKIHIFTGMNQMNMQLRNVFKTCLVLAAITGVAISSVPAANAGGGGGWQQPPAPPPPAPPSGSTQSTAILPTFVQLVQQGSQVFRTGRSFFQAGQTFFRTGRTLFSFLTQRPRRWFDPPTASGFVYTMSPDSNSLFTEIVDFPTGIDGDNLFTVSVGDTILGQFSPGQSVNFVDLLGHGVDEFAITGIDPLIDPESPNPFPLMLDFNTETADFTMADLEIFQPTDEQLKSVPEPSGALGLLAFGAIGAGVVVKRQRKFANRVLHNG